MSGRQIRCDTFSCATFTVTAGHTYEGVPCEQHVVLDAGVEGYERDRPSAHQAQFVVLSEPGPARRRFGRFSSAPGFTPARIVLVVSAIMMFAGYAAAQTSDTPTPASALKQMSLEELSNVEVTSVSKRPEKLSEAASAIQVITGEEIRRSGATSIPEALRLADNLDVAQINSHDWAISARGFNTALANKLLVLIDGRTVYTPLFSGVFWNVQDYLLQDIERIEVISGPGGTLWGANAVNGVINIITKSASDTQGAYLEGGGGTQLQDFAGMRYGGTLAPDVYFRIYGKYFDRGNDVFDNGSDVPDSWRMRQGGFRIDAKASPQNSFTLQGDLYGSDVNIPAGGQEHASGDNILGRWAHTYADGSDMSLQFYYDRTHLYDPISNPFGIAQILTDDLNTYDVDFQRRFRLGERQKSCMGTRLSLHSRCRR